MSYDSSMLSSSALYRIRFTLQDNDVYNEFLSDDEINYTISVSATESIATVTCAKRMLAQFSQYTRQKEHMVEVYGNEVFKQWKEYLQELIKELNGNSSTSYMIIGGVVGSEVDRVKSDSESVGVGYEQNYLANQRTWTSAGTLSNTSDNPFRLK